MRSPPSAHGAISPSVLALTLAGALLTGCGDDGPGGDDTPDADVDHGRYADVVDFPREGCADGAFSAVDVEAIYHLQVDYGDGFTFPIAARVDDLAVDWGGVIVGRTATRVIATEDDVLLHWTDADTGAVRALDLCARDADGTVRGHYASCPPADDPEGECFVLPAAGVAVEPLAEPVASGMTLLGEHGPWPAEQRGAGITVNVRVVDDIAYLARYQDGLRIVDVSNPASPVELGHQPVEFTDPREIWNDVKVVDGPDARRYALMGSNLVGVVVVDVTDPAAPSIVGHIGQPPAPGEPLNVHTLFVDGGKVYLTVGAGIQIYDLADPRAPVALGSYFHPDNGYVHDLYVSGDRAYLNYWDLGMAIVDVADPANPTLVGMFSGYGDSTSHSSWVTQIGERTIAIHGDEEWGAHLHVVDVTEGTAAFATSIAEYETRPEVSIHNVMAIGTRAYLSYYQDGVRILDLSNPEAPVEIAHYQTWPGYDRRYGYSFYEAAIGIDVDVARDRVYVADTVRGLLILEVTR